MPTTTTSGSRVIPTLALVAIAVVLVTVVVNAINPAGHHSPAGDRTFPPKVALNPTPQPDHKPGAKATPTPSRQDDLYLVSVSLGDQFRAEAVFVTVGVDVDIHGRNIDESIYREPYHLAPGQYLMVQAIQVEAKPLYCTIEKLHPDGHVEHIDGGPATIIRRAGAVLCDTHGTLS